MASRAPKGHQLFAQRVDEQLQHLLYEQVEVSAERSVCLYIYVHILIPIHYYVHIY